MAAECTALTGLKCHMLMLFIEILMVGALYANSGVNANAIDHASEAQPFAARAVQLPQPLRQ